jgi:L-amino acid N-acyltransferase YncA
MMHFQPTPLSSYRIRPIMLQDMAAVTAIYDLYVRHHPSSLEIVPPSQAEMTQRFEVLFSRHLPSLLLTRIDEGEKDREYPIGFAFTQTFRPRVGYRFTVEDQIYLAPAYEGQGLGTKLLEALIGAATGQGYRRMMALIGVLDPARQEESPALRLHRRLGFQYAGSLPAFTGEGGRASSVIFLERPLGMGSQDIPQHDPLDTP